jgi:MFS family permease
MYYLAAGSFWTLLAVSLLHAFALAPTTNLADAITLIASRRPAPSGFEYGWVRGAGSAAFIAATIVAGWAIALQGLSVNRYGRNCGHRDQWIGGAEPHALLPAVASDGLGPNWGREQLPLVAIMWLQALLMLAVPIALMRVKPSRARVSSCCSEIRSFRKSCSGPRFTPISLVQDGTPERQR